MPKQLYLIATWRQKLRCLDFCVFNGRNYSSLRLGNASLTTSVRLSEINRFVIPVLSNDDHMQETRCANTRTPE